MGIESFFPVQSEIIPILLKKNPFGGDICVSAPTGSGKTLTYVIPIVQNLISRIIPRIRALIIAPTRDLVKQIKEVFDKIINGTDLKVEILTGQTSFKLEQQKLNNSIDILISTPGRLVDHLKETNNFTLQHLEYFVIDEADRLLQQSYQDWLSVLLNSIYNNQNKEIIFNNDHDMIYIETKTIRSFNPIRKSITEKPLQKLIFSATLTYNPKKFSNLYLNAPKFYSSSAFVEYKMPETLNQFMIVCSLDEKPLILIYMLQNLIMEPSLCFTSSIDSTHRLYLLLKQFSLNIKIEEYSGILLQEKRNEILNEFKKGNIKLLICSDVMSRGLDLIDVQNVINYDVPIHIKNYIHRCGRTARAGKKGNSYTLIRPEEIHHFREMLLKVEGNKIKKKKISKQEIQSLIPSYKKALIKLKEIVEQEKRNKYII